MAKLNLNKINEICGKDLTVFQQNGICIVVKEFEDTLRAEYKRQYEQEYNEKLSNGIDMFIIAIAFVLHFSEKLKLGKRRLPEVMKEIEETVSMFNNKGEYTPQDYQKMLADDGIKIKMSWDKE